MRSGGATNPIEAVTAPQEAPRPEARARRLFLPGAGVIAGLTRVYGRFLTALIFLLSGLWVVGMIVLPQLVVLEQSLWTLERSGEEFEISLQIDRLYRDVELLSFDLMDLQAEEEQTPDVRRQIQELEGRIAATQAEIERLEGIEVAPQKVYTLANYTRMSGLHFQIFVKTIVASLFVTIVSLIVCYPIAYTVAHLSTPNKAALIMLGLIVPYAINELLRIFAWLMILDYNGVANTVIVALGGEPINFVGTSAGVFLAMVYAYVLFMVFPIYNTVETLDRNQIEAARDLGASTWRIHRRVVLPHAKPGIAVGCIMTFMLSAGSYSVPQIMTRGQGGDWFSQLIYRQFFEAFNWNIGAAYSFTLLLTCVAFIFLMMALFKVGVRDVAK
jgi:spermidine/putrescine transport system permease protein